jgi:hypothetical protein
VGDSVTALGISRRPVLVLIGGASLMAGASQEEIGELPSEIWRAVDASQAAIVDGGTDSGIMRLFGRARGESSSTSPLIGVAVESLVTWSGGPSGEERMELEPNHTHFVLVPGDAWGDEVKLLSAVASAVAQDRPSVTLMLNGGELTWQDAERSLLAGRNIVVVRGSGRASDEVAKAALGGNADDRASKLLQSGRVDVIGLNEGTQAIASQIEQRLSGA